MHEERLSPQLGRLIDAAKAEAARVDPTLPPTEVVALLTPSGAVYTGQTGQAGAAEQAGQAEQIAELDHPEAPVSAAEAAWALARAAGDDEVLVAAIAVTSDASQSVSPSPATCRSLAEARPRAARGPQAEGSLGDAPAVQILVAGMRRAVPTGSASGSSAPGRPVPTEGLTLERLVRPDQALLVRLAVYDLEAFGPTGLRTYDLAVMAEAGVILVARIEDEIVGSCQLLRVLDEPDFFYVVGFYVRPEWQGQGLGRKLLDAVTERCRELGAQGLILTVAPGNTKAMGLYSSGGFVDEAFVPHFYGKGEDRHILRLRFS